MIKKFKELNERTFEEILPKEEVEDQFLRLKEIVGCVVEIYYGEYFLLPYRTSI